MKKAQFDEHVATLYDELKLIVQTRYQEHGDDALHDAFLSIYQSKAYTRLHGGLSKGKITAWLVQAVIFCIRSRLRDESKYYRRYSLLSEIEAHSLYETVNGVEIGEVDEYPVDLIRDVKVAIGTLSAEHQSLIHAVYYEGGTLREIAKRIGETVYRVFTETEIAKACLRTQLECYRS